MSEPICKEFYVYALFRPWTGEPCYIGKGKGYRIREHQYRTRAGVHQNKHLSAIIRKAGGEIPAIILRSGLTESQAFETEMALISAIGRGTSGPLVNMTGGGEGSCGAAHSDATRIKISQSKKQSGWRPTAEHRSRISEFGTGRKMSAECIAKRTATRAAQAPSAQRIEHRKDHARRHLAKSACGTRWWTTKSGVAYRAKLPRSSDDTPGRPMKHMVSLFETDACRSCSGTKWWASKDGTVYRSVEPRDQSDQQGRRWRTPC